MPFRPWGPDHLAALVVTGLACAAAWAAARGGSRATAFFRWGAVGLLSALMALLYGFRLRDGLQPEYDLPLWLCDWAFFLCLAALLRPVKRVVEVAYYWAMAGTFQALITPDLLVGAPSWEYFLFFLGHGAIMATVVFLLAFSQVIPDGQGVLVAWAALLGYTLVVGGLDYAFGWNYGYLRAKPPVPSLLDALGPWPLYVVAGELVALGLFVLLWLPWRVAGQRSGIQ